MAMHKISESLRQAKAFEAQEDILERGVKIFLKKILGDHFTDEEISELVSILRTIRNNQGSIKETIALCPPVFMAEEIFPNFFSSVNTINVTLTKFRFRDRPMDQLPLTLQEVRALPVVPLIPLLCELSLRQELG